jgi:hypothetical protein
MRGSGLVIGSLERMISAHVLLLGSFSNPLGWHRMHRH